MSANKRKNDFKDLQDKAKEWRKKKEADKEEQERKKAKNSGNDSQMDPQDPMGTKGGKKWDAPTLAKFFEAAGQAIQFESERIDERRKRATAILKEIDGAGAEDTDDDESEEAEGGRRMGKSGKGSNSKAKGDDSDEGSDPSFSQSSSQSESDADSEKGENVVAKVQTEGVRLRSSMKGPVQKVSRNHPYLSPNEQWNQIQTTDIHRRR